MAVGLLALALFLLAALIPVSVLGPRGGEWFPLGNMVGVVGETVQRALTGLVGIAALFLPGLLLFGGLRAWEWLSVGWTARLSILRGGLLWIVPVGLGILGQDGEAVVIQWCMRCRQVEVLTLAAYECRRHTHPDPAYDDFPRWWENE